MKQILKAVLGGGTVVALVLVMGVGKTRAIDEPESVYVDNDYSEDLDCEVDEDNDGHCWGVDAFDNIPDAIDAVAVGGTVNVAAGNYFSEDTLFIEKELSLVGPGIDVESEEDAAYIGVNESGYPCDHAVSIDAENVTVSGFYIWELFEGDYCTGGGSKPVIRVRGEGDDSDPYTGVTITQNDIAGGNRGIATRSDVAGTTISYNKIHDNYDGIVINGTEGTAINNNELYDNDTGLELDGDSGEFSCDECDDDLGGTSINNNDIHDNEDVGVYVNDGVDTSGVSFELNKIYDNGEDEDDEGIATSELEESFDARENWWGEETGPYNNDTNPDGEGNSTNSFVLYRPFYTDEEMETLSTSEVDSEDLNGLFDSGAFDAGEDDADDVETITVNEDVTITSGDSSVEIPAGTNITKTGGGTFDGTAMSATGVDAATLTGLGSRVTAEGALEWGADVGLTFDPAITLHISVGAEHNGKTLQVKRSPDGGVTWTQDGIEAPKTCVVAAGICTFQATKASIYASTSTSGGSTGGYLSPEALARLLGQLPAGPGRGDPANLGRYGLHEGDVTGGEGDPDVYIVNEWGYKRLFLNPAIFNFYGHLGGFAKVRRIVAAGRDALPTSGLFRNCETDDQKVYAVEVSGEDTGTLHHVNLSGEQASAQDPDFFKKVFCINTSEFNWYPKSPTPYSALSQVPVYHR